MRTWPDSNASAIERFLRQRRIYHPQTPKTYRRVLCGFQDVVRRCERSPSRVSLQTLKGWLQERSGEWSAFTLLHRACIIDRFLDFLVREGSIASNPVAELRTKYLIKIKGSATIVRALLAPEPDRALEALRQLPRFGSVLGDLMRNHVALMRTRGFRYDTNTRMFLRFDRYLQRHPELANEPVPVMLQRWAAARSTAFHAVDCELLGRALAKARHHVDSSAPILRPGPHPQRRFARGCYRRAHGITIGPDDSIWLTDVFDHTVRKCTPDGKVLMTIGVGGKPARAMSGEPFNQCTHVAIKPHTGDLFVSDGYLNPKVHKYAPDGRLLYSWGHSRAPTQGSSTCLTTSRPTATASSMLPIAITIACRCSRRTASSNISGQEWRCRVGSASTPAARTSCATSASSALCGGRRGAPDFWAAWNRPGMGPRVSIYSLDGKLQARLCDNGQGDGRGQLTAPHGIAVTPEGDILVAEVSYTILGRTLNPRRPVRNFLRLAKLKKSEHQTHV
jgi:hypothetical protein